MALLASQAQTALCSSAPQGGERQVGHQVKKQVDGPNVRKVSQSCDFSHFCSPPSTQHKNQPLVLPNSFFLFKFKYFLQFVSWRLILYRLVLQISPPPQLINMDFDAEYEKVTERHRFWDLHPLKVKQYHVQPPLLFALI